MEDIYPSSKINYNSSIINITYKLYKLLLKYNYSSQIPLWNSVIEIPVPILKNTIENSNDEYVYWSN